MEQVDGFTTESQLKALAEVNALRSQVNEQFGKAGNTTTTGITTGTGLVSIPLEAPAKSLYSVYTRLRQRVPRESDGKGGLSITWRALTSIYNGGYDAGIAEGAVGSTVQFTEADVSAAYKTLGRLASATYEAISASQTFDDVVSKATLGGLQNLQVSEELSIIGGCATGIAKPGALSFADTVAAGAGSLTPSTAYYYAVSAVTLLGTDWVNGTGARGIVSAVDSPNETDAVTGNHTTTGSGAGSTATVVNWAAVPGAFAYNVYVGTTSTVHFRAQVTVNTFTLSTAPSGTGNLPNAANQTANALQFDGIVTQAALASGALLKDMAGASLTAGTGSVNEIDAMLETLFRTPKVAPSLLLVSGHEAQTIRNLVLSAGTSVSTQRFNVDVGPDGAIRAGSIFMEYTNPFFPGQPIEVMAHPYMPQGTAVVLTEKLPPWYPNANVPSTWAVDTRREFYSIEYAIATSSGRVKPIGVYVEEVLKGYAPTFTGVIQGIGA
jgi:6,7-dimethyl-8-ribityllumazine synthase